MSSPRVLRTPPLPRLLRRARRPVVLGGVAALLLAVVAGCGLPQGGEATRVPAEDVPYGLLTTPTTQPSTDAAYPSIRGAIYLVDENQLLVPTAVAVTNTPLRPLVQSLLTRLAVGPTDRERARGLLTDLGPGAAVILRSVTDGTATIELRAPVQDPSPVRFPVAIGQIVLTATSVVGIDRVAFVQEDGTPANVPVPPAGDLSTAPLTAAEYASLLAPGLTEPTRTTPLPGDDPVPSATPTTTSAG